MPAPRKPKPKSGKNTPPSALDSEKRVLQERQRQINDKIDALNRTIRESYTPSYQINNTIPAAAPLAAGKRPVDGRRLPKKVVLRAEKQEGRLQTIALLLVVIALIALALYRFA